MAAGRDVGHPALLSPSMLPKDPSESSLKIQIPEAYLRLSESKHTGMGGLEDPQVTLMQTNGGPRTESFNSIFP